MDIKNIKFEKNVGGLDRALRAVIGLAMILAAIIDSNAPYAWIYLLGFIPLATAAFQFCGAYKVLGINTCSKP
ncbi:hypothetical protein CCR83_13490 [Rhodobacter veldkampii DSM 11550]|uniref:DUF2892 domain-containing protein n=1 Tax=Phaeovulum veldkampii DSM 11550 TaxID=1185920 RepID=A0A2T4JL89_9RHOB|nr:DUF2892 domain-containing protein [Phaeovulum veldkampii]MBK5947430.1 hypothetical protein [Phaeovulum veldkampii DSM 11550]NCU20101.1 DUF2892 domain-containing protein [Candidatus Falkowbacteria bacterium]PTE18527.1 DUF2892 domain-containing protein [Phaeovulum veldkampii DSM 11550]TDQ59191.1 DUF2892 family protein [Phaeovulum veldkampii DSM 11550]